MHGEKEQERQRQKDAMVTKEGKEGDQKKQEQKENRSAEDRNKRR